MTNEERFKVRVQRRAIEILDGRAIIHESKLELVIDAVREAIEAEQRERLRGVKLEMKAQGQFRGGPRAPFGWRVEDGKMVKDAGEQKAIRKARRLAKQGESLRSIAEVLRSDGFAVSHVTIAKIVG